MMLLTIGSSGDIEALVVRHSNATKLDWMLQLDVRTGLLMDIKAGFQQGPQDFSGLEAAESGHRSDADFEFFSHRLGSRKRVLGDFFIDLEQTADMARDRVLRHLPRFG